MNKKRPEVLIVDDEPNILNTMSICLEDIGFKITKCQDSKEAMKIIKNELFDLAFVDLKMIPVDGLTILQAIKKQSPSTTVVIITAHGSVESAVEAIKKGAYDYLQKPFDLVELQLLANKVLEYHNLKGELDVLRKQIKKTSSKGDIITCDEKMLEMVELAERVAETNLSVLIEGESGTGKELIARLIYNKSNRLKKPFVKINCAALPENLLESELFGHVKGAFTGAIKDRQGRFEYADGGTLFLDEIAELTPKLQAKLLRILQSGEYERLGESITRKVDVRIIAATNKNLEEAINEETFRKDLFYRLNAVRIKLIPLRERPHDISMLIHYFLDKFSTDNDITISSKAMNALKLYRWSGNVRELENTMQRIVLLAKNNCVDFDDLPEEVKTATTKDEQLYSLEEMEKIHIKKILQITDDYKKASNILGIDPATLWRKRKKYGL